jgi:hypothetical protein
MNKLRFLISLILCCFFLVPHAFAQMPEEVLSFANNDGLNSFKSIMSEDPTGYGFKDKEEIENSTLGQSFPVYWIDSEKLRAAKSTDTLSSVIKNTNQWQFVVLSNGQPKSFLSVEQGENGLVLVSAGGSSTAFMKAYEQIKAASDQDSEPLLVMIQGTRVLMSSKDNQEIAVSEANTVIHGIQNTKAAPTNDLVATLKNIQNSTEQHKDSGTFLLPQSESASFWSQTVLVSLAVSIIVIAIIVIALSKRKKT